METTFWQNKWKNNEIAFNQLEANPLLVKYFKRLSLKQGARICLPLCGKTTDATWLVSCGYEIVGIELVEMAIEQFFQEQNLGHQVMNQGNLKRYSSERIEMLVGDIFDATKTALGRIDAIYDRAALVALPSEMRNRYTKHIREISDGAPQLLITIEYDETLMDGPPFNVPRDEVERLYENFYKCTLLEVTPIPDGLKGIEASECVWLLERL